MGDATIVDDAIPDLDGSGIDQFRAPGKEVILYPPQYKDGDLMAPFDQ
jgi:hypothetical protein